MQDNFYVFIKESNRIGDAFVCSVNWITRFFTIDHAELSLLRHILDRKKASILMPQTKICYSKAGCYDH